MKTVFAAALLVAALLAGCAGDDPKPEAVADVPDDPVSKELGENVVAAPLPSENVTLSVDTPFLMPSTSGPDAPIAAFKWRIPEGAIIEYQPIEDLPEFTFELIFFEMMPIFTNDVKLDKFAIFVVNLEDEAYITSSYLGVPSSGTQTSTLLDTQTYSYEPTLEGGAFAVFAGELEAGDEIGFILVGRSEAPGSFGLLMSAMKDQPGENYKVPKDAADLLDGRSAATLTPTGKGAGFAFGAYVNFNLNFLTSIYHSEETAGTVTVEDRQRTPTEPVATVRDATVSTSYEGRGYGEAVADMFSFELITPCAAAGKFDIQMDEHGSTVDYQSLIAELPQVGGIASVLTGYPIALAVGEGEGAASASLDFQLANNCALDLVLVQQTALGATMQDLFGVPAATGSASFSGIAGNLPPTRMWTQGDDLVILDAAGLHTLVGRAPLLAPAFEAGVLR